MTAKDFEQIAAILLRDFPHEEGRVTALRFAKSLSERFPKFDRGKFLKACGFTPVEAAALRDLSD